MAMTNNEVVALVADDLAPRYAAELKRVETIDVWARWEHPKPYLPRRADRELRQLAELSRTPWLALVVSSIAQTLFVEGYRSPTAETEAPAWRYWQANGMDARQVALHRAALTYGTSYTLVLPGTTMTGETMPSIRGMSPRNLFAAYVDPADDLPAYALRVDSVKGRQLIDDDSVYTLAPVRDRSDAYQVVAVEEHGAGVCPVVRFSTGRDLEGRSPGEVEPHVALAQRINQTTYDRLVVQRFAAFIVRTVTGMDLEASAAANGTTVEDMKVRLAAGDFLASKDPSTQFGSLPASPIGGYIESERADIYTLAAVTQTPAHELLGQMANLSAEALAAARASQTAKSDELRHSLGEAHELNLRVAALVAGNRDGASDYESQVRWKDTEIRSLSQAADALGKLAQMLGVPVEMLWEKVPGWTQQDVDRARAMSDAGGPVVEPLSVSAIEAITA